MSKVCKRYGISDVALKKACLKVDIPTPERGYWAKKDAGGKTIQVPLPPRPPGMEDEVVIGGGGGYWHQPWSTEVLLGPVPPPPEFPEPIETVRERIANVLGKVTVPRDFHNWHPAIDRYIRKDDSRRQALAGSSYVMSWDKPMFDTPFERRRLRILNRLFLAAGKMHGRPRISGREARSIYVAFHQQGVSIILDRPRKSYRGEFIPSTPPVEGETKLFLSILRHHSNDDARFTWQDDEHSRLESHMTEIALELILAAEVQYREHAIHQHEWRIRRKAELEEEAIRRKLEAERAERERQRRLEQARVDRLLKDAKAFQQAGEIRKYVEAIQLAQSGNMTSSVEEFERWRQWALAQADRIDPAVGGVFQTSMKDEEEPRK